MKSGWDHSFPGRCFNSGLMLLEPGDPDLGRVRKRLWDPSPAGLARCKGLFALCLALGGPTLISVDCNWIY